MEVIFLSLTDGDIGRLEWNEKQVFTGRRHFHWEKLASLLYIHRTQSRVGSVPAWELSWLKNPMRTHVVVHNGIGIPGRVRYLVRFKLATNVVVRHFARPSVWRLSAILIDCLLSPHDTSIGLLVFMYKAKIRSEQEKCNEISFSVALQDKDLSGWLTQSRAQEYQYRR